MRTIEVRWNVMSLSTKKSDKAYLPWKATFISWYLSWLEHWLLLPTGFCIMECVDRNIISLSLMDGWVMSSLTSLSPRTFASGKLWQLLIADGFCQQERLQQQWLSVLKANVHGFKPLCNIGVEGLANWMYKFINRYIALHISWFLTSYIYV